MNCKECEKTEGATPENVPYIVYESERARSERHIKRMWIALIVLVAMIFATNAVWLWAWTRYDYETVTVDSADGGNANYIGNDGDIYNGEGYGQKTDQTEEAGEG